MASCNFFSIPMYVLSLELTASYGISYWSPHAAATCFGRQPLRYTRQSNSIVRASAMHRRKWPYLEREGLSTLLYSVYRYKHRKAISIYQTAPFCITNTHTEQVLSSLLPPLPQHSINIGDSQSDRKKKK